MQQTPALAHEDAKLAEHEELRSLDHFLHSAITRGSHFGLSSALGVLSTRQLTRSSWDDEVDPLDDLPDGELMRVLAVSSDVLRLTFIRAFLGSFLWFVSWPGALWATKRFPRIKLDSATEANGAALMVEVEMIERTRLILVGNAPRVLHKAG